MFFPRSESKDKQLKEKILKTAEEYLNAEIRLISACQDEEQTLDCSDVHKRFNLRKSKRASLAIGNDGGACTSALLKILYQHVDKPEKYGSVPTWSSLLFDTKKLLKKTGYKQVPVLTGSRPISMDDEFSIIPKNFNGTRRALMIAIGYKGGFWPLPGTHNDSHNMMKYLKKAHGFKDEDFTILMDDGIHKNPTKENIMKALHRFAFAIKPGDAVFFHYAGHGTSKVNGTRVNQLLAPVDHMTLPMYEYEIIDDEIFRIFLTPLQKGVQMTAIVDACHSGSMFDLPFEFVGDERYESGKEMDYRKVDFPFIDIVKAERDRIENMKEIKRSSQIEHELIGFRRSIMLTDPLEDPSYRPLAGKKKTIKKHPPKSGKHRSKSPVPKQPAVKKVDRTTSKSPVRKKGSLHDSKSGDIKTKEVVEKQPLKKHAPGNASRTKSPVRSAQSNASQKAVAGTNNPVKKHPPKKHAPQNALRSKSPVR